MEMKADVKAMSDEHQVSLFCVKKAQSFERWLLTSGQQRPSFLLSDWREAKPCAEFLVANSNIQQPLHFVVHLQQTKQREPATTWARGLPFPVHLVETWASGRSLLNTLLAQQGWSDTAQASEGLGARQDADEGYESAQDSGGFASPLSSLAPSSPSTSSASSSSLDGLPAGTSPATELHTMVIECLQQFGAKHHHCHPWEAALSLVSNSIAGSSVCETSMAQVHVSASVGDIQVPASLAQVPSPVVCPPPGLPLPSPQSPPPRTASALRPPGQRSRASPTAPPPPPRWRDAGWPPPTSE